MAAPARIRKKSSNARFNGKLRDELLNGEIFCTLKEAKAPVEQSRIHHNTVRPHNSLVYFPPGPDEIGRSVGARLVLGGAIRRDRETIRVSAHVADIRNREQV